jgi:uncharacterized caspase-like protein
VGEQVFSAYAFNEDRVKSETASAVYIPPSVPERERRAFVINIGIDDYENERFNLNYAVNDAEQLDRVLADIPGFEIRQVTLASELRDDGTRTQVDGAAILDALRLVLSDDGREERLRSLAEKGIDASTLEQATPDDIVIISYSGHGWADPRGNFFLVPSDARWDIGMPTPDLGTIVSSAQLSDILQAIQAGEITLILDACHSAASVESSGFKPGPMGDGGLGQLAYDKGILILAATQADDVALENNALGQGLLSFALVEGLREIEDPEGDGISLPEWLQYAAERVPTLMQDVIDSQLRGGFTVENSPAHQTRSIQQPTLFNFNQEPSPVRLGTDKY